MPLRSQNILGGSIKKNTGLFGLALSQCRNDKPNGENDRNVRALPGSTKENSVFDKSKIAAESDTEASTISINITDPNSIYVTIHKSSNESVGLTNHTKKSLRPEVSDISETETEKENNYMLLKVPIVSESSEKYSKESLISKQSDYSLRTSDNLSDEIEVDISPYVSDNELDRSFRRFISKSSKDRCNCPRKEIFGVNNTESPSILSGSRKSYKDKSIRRDKRSSKRSVAFKSHDTNDSACNCHRNTDIGDKFAFSQDSEFDHHIRHPTKTKIVKNRSTKSLDYEVEETEKYIVLKPRSRQNLSSRGTESKIPCLKRKIRSPSTSSIGAVDKNSSSKENIRKSSSCNRDSDTPKSILRSKSKSQLYGIKENLYKYTSSKNNIFHPEDNIRDNSEDEFLQLVRLEQEKCINQSKEISDSRLQFITLNVKTKGRPRSRGGSSTENIAKESSVEKKYKASRESRGSRTKAGSVGTQHTTTIASTSKQPQENQYCESNKVQQDHFSIASKSSKRGAIEINHSSDRRSNASRRTHQEEESESALQNSIEDKVSYRSRLLSENIRAEPSIDSRLVLNSKHDQFHSNSKSSYGNRRSNTSGRTHKEESEPELQNSKKEKVSSRYRPIPENIKELPINTRSVVNSEDQLYSNSRSSNHNKKESSSNCRSESRHTKEESKSRVVPRYKEESVYQDTRDSQTFSNPRPISQITEEESIGEETREHQLHSHPITRNTEEIVYQDTKETHSFKKSRSNTLKPEEPSTSKYRSPSEKSRNITKELTVEPITSKGGWINQQDKIFSYRPEIIAIQHRNPDRKPRSKKSTVEKIFNKIRFGSKDRARSKSKKREERNYSARRNICPITCTRPRIIASGHYRSPRISRDCPSEREIRRIDYRDPYTEYISSKEAKQHKHHSGLNSPKHRSTSDLNKSYYTVLTALDERNLQEKYCRRLADLKEMDKGKKKISERRSKSENKYVMPPPNRYYTYDFDTSEYSDLMDCKDCCREDNRQQLLNTMICDSPDIYRSVFGPTLDETILAGISKFKTLVNNYKGEPEQTYEPRPSHRHKMMPTHREYKADSQLEAQQLRSAESQFKMATKSGQLEAKMQSDGRLKDGSIKCLCPSVKCECAVYEKNVQSVGVQKKVQSQNTGTDNVGKKTTYDKHTQKTVHLMDKNICSFPGCDCPNCAKVDCPPKLRFRHIGMDPSMDRESYSIPSSGYIDRAVSSIEVSKEPSEVQNFDKEDFNDISVTTGFQTAMGDAPSTPSREISTGTPTSITYPATSNISNSSKIMSSDITSSCKCPEDSEGLCPVKELEIQKIISPSNSGKMLPTPIIDVSTDHLSQPIMGPDGCKNFFPTETRFAITKILKYDDFTTYEIYKSTKSKPKVLPKDTEGVFVLKNKLTT